MKTQPASASGASGSPATPSRRVLRGHGDEAGGIVVSHAADSGRAAGVGSPKRGLWYAEPKLNGWRALIHTPTGTMWNRHGALLTIADCFRPALGALTKLADRGLEWADCEALERRHNLGRGTLVVLDVVPEFGAPGYEQRRAMLEAIIPTDAVFSGDTSRPVPCGTVWYSRRQQTDEHRHGFLTKSPRTALRRSLLSG